MNSFNLQLPSQGIFFGSGRISDTGALVRRFGERCMLVAGIPPPEALIHSLRDAGVVYEIFDKVIPNPTFESIDAAAEIARRSGSQFVLAVGGGSAMDTGKGAAVAATHEGSIWNYAIGKREVLPKTLPVVAIPTTSGTGSHCTQFAVISNNHTKQKPGMGSACILPAMTVIDPELMLTMPKTGTFFTGFDVFAHGAEAYTSKAATPFSDIFAEKAITLAARWLPEVCSDGSNLEARAGMALADTCAGIAISHAMVTLGHAMAHVLGGHYAGLAHGDALFSIYREILAFNAKGMKDRHSFIANALLKECDDPVEAFDSFFAQFGMKGSLPAKAGKDDAERIASDVFTYMKGVAELNSVPPGKPDAVSILEKSIAA